MCKAVHHGALPRPHDCGKKRRPAAGRRWRWSQPRARWRARETIRSRETESRFREWPRLWGYSAATRALGLFPSVRRHRKVGELVIIRDPAAGEDDAGPE